MTKKIDLSNNEIDILERLVLQEIKLLVQMMKDEEVPKAARNWFAGHKNKLELIWDKLEEKLDV